MDSIIIRITDLAKTHGITGAELGRRLNLKKSPLTDWKNGQSKPTIDQLLLLCDIFAVSSDYLLTGNCRSINNDFPAYNNSDSALLQKYKALPTEDQEEINLMIRHKYDRAFPEEKSSTSNNGNQRTKNETTA